MPAPLKYFALTTAFIAVTFSYTAQAGEYPRSYKYNKIERAAANAESPTLANSMSAEDLGKLVPAAGPVHKKAAEAEKEAQ